jgi:hypothetical protein
MWNAHHSHCWNLTVATLNPPSRLAGSEVNSRPTAFPRIRKMLFAFASAISLLLAILVVAMWVRGYFVGDSYLHVEADGALPKRILTQHYFRTFSGGFAADFYRLPAPLPELELSAPRDSLGAMLAGMQAQVARQNFTARLKQPIPPWRHLAPPSRPPGVNGGHRFYISVERSYPGAIVAIAVISWWVLVLAFAPLPAFWLVLFIRRARMCKPGCCVRCGYNLTGNTSGVCPECGASLLERDMASGMLNK